MKGWIAHGDRAAFEKVNTGGHNKPNMNVGPTYGRPLDPSSKKDSFNPSFVPQPFRSEGDMVGETERRSEEPAEAMDHDAGGKKAAEGETSAGHTGNHC